MNLKDNINHTGIYGLILNKNNEVLLIKKNRGPYKNLLDLPGGTPNFNETLETTLKREIYEETGLKILKSKQLITLLTIFEHSSSIYRHLGIIYLLDIKGDAKLDADGEDSDGCIWINIESINIQTCSPFVYQLKDKGYMNN